jgi:hypothetical protein
MCCIITSPDRAHRPDRSTLRACAEMNPHGIGFAWTERGAVYYLKGMTLAALDRNLREVPGPVVVHFRYATVGKVSKALCHPFAVMPRPGAKVYGSAPAVLFHNGTWAGWERYLVESEVTLRGPISDSRVAAVAAHYHGVEWLRQLPGKFAVLDAEAHIRHLGNWTKLADGCLYSNTFWLGRVKGGRR